MENFSQIDSDILSKIKNIKRNIKNPMPYNLNRYFLIQPNKKMVGRGRFERPTNGLKIHCSTG